MQRADAINVTLYNQYPGFVKTSAPLSYFHPLELVTLNLYRGTEPHVLWFSLFVTLWHHLLSKQRNNNVVC